jgi:ABC-type branched-subunit amino acid transport system substrate-binding protein
MTPLFSTCTRRHLLGRGTALGLSALGLGGSLITADAQAQEGRARAAGGRSSAAGSARRFVQILDMSNEQQELSRDYSTGIRLAWALEGRPGRPLAGSSLVTLNTHGTDADAQAVVQQCLQDDTVAALVGTVGDAMAVRVQALLQAAGKPLAHIGPWMSDDRYEQADHLALLFASRTTQMRKALSAIHGMGLDELCVVYASAADQGLFDPQVSSMARTVSLRLQRRTLAPGQSVSSIAGTLPPSSGVILCLTTSAEVAQITQAMAQRRDHRFVLALGDVDAPSLMQFAPAKGVPVILTQVVPNPVKSRIPVVERFRTQLSQLFDETPSTISLAGYLAGLYAASLVRDSSADRDALWEQVARRKTVDLGGWKVDFQGTGRGNQFVNQTLLTERGDLIG